MNELGWQVESSMIRNTSFRGVAKNLQNATIVVGIPFEYRAFRSHCFVTDKIMFQQVHSNSKIYGNSENSGRHQDQLTCLYLQELKWSVGAFIVFRLF